MYPLAVDNMSVCLRRVKSFESSFNITETTETGSRTYWRESEEASSLRRNVMNDYDGGYLLNITEIKPKKKKNSVTKGYGS